MSRRQSGVRGALAVYLGSDGFEACGPGTRRRGSDLRAFAAAASRFAVSLSAASLASRSARWRAVFSASACRGVLALVSELTFFAVLNCSSARRRLALPGRGWECIGMASSLQVDDLAARPPADTSTGLCINRRSDGLFKLILKQIYEEPKSSIWRFSRRCS